MKHEHITAAQLAQIAVGFITADAANLKEREREINWDTALTMAYDLWERACGYIDELDMNTRMKEMGFKEKE